MTSAQPSVGYSRVQPSPRYTELLGYYQTFHREGDPARGQSPQETFDGRSLPPQAWRIKCLIDMHGASSLLDYGAGKGLPYRVSPFILPDGTTADDLQSYWGLSSITLYDPAYAPHNALPAGQFDAVISTDMLEHCAEEDLRWILAEMFAYSSKFLFTNVASFPAKKTLPDGTNAHCTIKPVTWWQQLFIDVARNHPSVRWYAVVQTRTDDPNGQISFVEHLLKG